MAQSLDKGGAVAIAGRENHLGRDAPRLFLLSLAVRLVVASSIARPGYMDVAYYAAGAVRLAEGGGLSELFLWNYLDDPAGLPRPGFLYWMPLPAIVGAPFAVLFSGSFFALQLPFALLSALLPLLAYVVAWEAFGRRRAAWLAALFTLFSGYFVPYWSLPETFAPFALFGGLALWLAGRQRPQDEREMREAGYWLLIGVLTGLAHLTRADGVLILPVVALAPLIHIKAKSYEAPHPCRRVVGRWVLITLGYLVVMSFWFVRNLSATGTILSSAGTKTIWLREYDDLYCYGCDLSMRSYLAWGWDNILSSKLSAFWINLQRFLAEDCQVFLLPFVLVGLYRLYKRPVFAISTVYLFLLLLVHSFVFTFPGWRGGFFHSSSAVLPILFVAGTEGLEAAVRWAARRRRWKMQQAQAVFATAAVAAAVALSSYAAVHKSSAWRGVDMVYEEIGHWLDVQGLLDNVIVMVDNPPGFYYHTRIPSVVVPNGDIDTLLDVCKRYGVGYLVLDSNRPAPLQTLYEGLVLSPHLVPAEVFGEGRVKVWKVEW
jgi:4-amino-4-deoxy-L-arabinose transferase-like glycosyltransferase